jgi:MOSC domain-containing protein YiiM
MASLPPDSELARLFAQFPRAGRVEWIGLRPARAVSMEAVDAAEAVTGKGLVGDRYVGASGKRGITLIQAEHLPVVAALAGHGRVAAATLRRNLVVAGIPLVALKDRRFRIGEVVLEGTGPCDPCSRMEDALGPGGYNAMRGHGGICARIVAGGVIRPGDRVEALAQ